MRKLDRYLSLPISFIMLQYSSTDIRIELELELEHDACMRRRMHLHPEPCKLAHTTPWATGCVNMQCSRWLASLSQESGDALLLPPISVLQLVLVTLPQATLHPSLQS